MNFDDSGRLHGRSETDPFTVSGIGVKSVESNSKVLFIQGTRVGIVFGDQEVKRVELGVGNKTNGKVQPITIQIGPSATGDYGAALDAIFASDLADFVPSLPDYWQVYGKEYLSSGVVLRFYATDQKLSSVFPKIGGAVTPPRVLHAPAPGSAERPAQR